MKQRRSKPKIKTCGKSYPLSDSVLYKLSSKKRLAHILFSTPQELKLLARGDNYRCFLMRPKSGKARMIQEPLPKLDKIHTRVASLLCRIEVFDGLHSGRKGRSNISNAKPHMGEGKSVITADISNFFSSTSRFQVFDFFFDVMRCSSDVADILASLLTINGHIPTGSRVSMPLAYFANLKMFDEVRRLASRANAEMTLYVDDMTFSGERLRKCFVSSLFSVLRKYGHTLRQDKIRYYRPTQVKLITGAAVKGGAIFPRNSHLYLLHQDMKTWLSSEEPNSVLTGRILGRMTFLSGIDPRFRDKARSFRRAAFS